MTANGPSPRQLPLDLAHQEARSRDDLIVAPANEQAVALVENWPDWPAPLIVLAGPAGCGKSHLAEIWRTESGACGVPASRIDADAIAAAEAGPVLLDDADDPHLDETGLFHLINAVRANNSHLLLTARRFPGGWGIALPDLLSRLKAATTIEIQEPDDALLSGVIVKLFADRQVVIEPHVVQFIVRRMERSLSTAQRLVSQLDKVALERKARVTRSLASGILSALEAGEDRPI